MDHRTGCLRPAQEVPGPPETTVCAHHPFAVAPRLPPSKVALKDAVVVPESVSEEEIARAMGLG